MQAVKRPYVMAAAALAATGLVSATPMATQMTRQAVDRAVRSVETNLVDASIFNIPFNLFQEIVNIPASEIDAVNYASESLFNSGPWFVVSATNLWGVDQGDPSHFMSVMNFLVPFEGLSGINAPETDFDGGLGQQLWGLVATTLPTNGACDAMDCLPVSPTSPITGIGGVDWFLHLNDILDGKQPFPLLENWFQTPLDQLWPGAEGYTWLPGAEGAYDPSGPAYTIFDNIPGTGAGDAYPWEGLTYHLEPWVPFQNWINDLMADPDYSNFQIPSFDEVGRAFQSLLAASAVFTPFTPGSPFCPGDCSFITDNHLDYPDLIKDINNLWPGNETIQTWVDAYDSGMANVPTEDQIQNSINILQQGFWDFNNPSPTDGPDYSATIAEWQTFWTSLGFDTTNNVAPGDFAGQFAALANSFSPEQLTDNFTALANAFSPEQLTADFGALATAFSPEQLTADLTALLGTFDTGALAGAAIDPGVFANVLDPAALTADWTALLAGIGL
ncbi:hypothetical protein PT015_10770 [Candidatus Mycobacterium wuenschmannii]|uniref:Uncharacterized protein n=1 Tax=Candidatus Mycobacterium wuenschmannii TaxID=3027808 RepID=A0ABY8W7W9_9MYCO|nr:hypothetical protein [Candidatus Mycobacterium wuenschmannii]WIM89859.1 hypothetical protein PT015_10770 [Candidatus Mycobacterium wuenschmannii]